MNHTFLGILRGWGDMDRIRKNILVLIISELFIIFTLTACVENSPFDYGIGVCRHIYSYAFDGQKY